MITDTQRKKWITARDAVVEVAMERKALVAPTEKRFRTTMERLDAVEEEIGKPTWTCIGCSAPIFTDDKYQNNMDEDPSCPGCSITYGDLQKDPDHWIDCQNLEPVGKDYVGRKIAEHLATDGSLSDPAFLSVAS